VIFVGTFLIALSVGLGILGALPFSSSINLRVTLLSSVGIVGFPGLFIYSQAAAPVPLDLGSLVFVYLVIVLLSVTMRPVLIRQMTRERKDWETIRPWTDPKGYIRDLFKIF
jgi:hypothetical protein